MDRLEQERLLLWKVSGLYQNSGESFPIPLLMYLDTLQRLKEIQGKIIHFLSSHSYPASINSTSEVLSWTRLKFHLVQDSFSDCGKLGAGGKAQAGHKVSGCGHAESWEALPVLLDLFYPEFQELRNKCTLPALFVNQKLYSSTHLYIQAHLPDSKSRCQAGFEFQKKWGRYIVSNKFDQYCCGTSFISLGIFAPECHCLIQFTWELSVVLGMILVLQSHPSCPWTELLSAFWALYLWRANASCIFSHMPIHTYSPKLGIITTVYRYSDWHGLLVTTYWH